jgi:NADPH2:quinone reductase
MVQSWVMDDIGVNSLKLKDHPIKKPIGNEVLIKQNTIGVNKIDLLQVDGSYKMSLPAIIGCEACGVVEEVGPDVIEFKKGDRVAYATSPGGAYVEMRNIVNKFLVPVPDYIADEDASAILMKGMTAHMLLRRTFFANKDNTLLIHNASSGFGQIMCTLAKYYESKVIATVSGESNKKLVEKLNVDKVIDIKEENLKDMVIDFTKGAGVHAAFDYFGSATFSQSLACLSYFGLLVNMIDSYGRVSNVDISKLFRRSNFMTSPSLFVYKKDRAELLLSSNEIFALKQKKKIHSNIVKKYKFTEVKEAHSDFRSGYMAGQGVILV